MINNPDPSKKPRYVKIKELDSNTQTSQKTYLGKNKTTEKLVIIKEFGFAQQTASWGGVKAYQNQINALSKLNHPGIPAYLKCFATKDGLGIIREYKEAKSLAEPRNFEPEEIKKVAINLLEILIYLQQLEKPVFHKNIKPENILIDEEFNAFLTDFGLPVIDIQGTIKNSKAGTIGFIPREQERNKKLTKSTDLYGLAVSLICALTQTPSAQVDKLIGADGRFNITGVIPSNISMDFVEWLEKMLQPYPRSRYADAAAALEALRQLDVSRSPLPTCDCDFLEFKANLYGEKLVQTVQVINRVPDTLLEGSWQMMPHPSEAKNSKSLSKSNWISVNPDSFEKNKVECKITVDTSKLMADRIYERELFLETNSSAPNPSLKIAVQTAPILTDKLPKIPLILLLVAAVAAGYFGGTLCDELSIIFIELSYLGLFLGLTFSIMGGFAAAFSLIPMLGSSLTFVTFFYLIPLPFHGDTELLVGYVIGMAVWTFAGSIMRRNCGRSLPAGQVSSLIIAIMSPVGIVSSLLALFGISCGIALNSVAVFGLFIKIIFLTTGISLGVFLFQRHFKQVKQLTKYQMSLSRLVKP